VSACQISTTAWAQRHTAFHRNLPLDQNNLALCRNHRPIRAKLSADRGACNVQRPSTYVELPPARPSLFVFSVLANCRDNGSTPSPGASKAASTVGTHHHVVNCAPEFFRSDVKVLKRSGKYLHNAVNDFFCTFVATVSCRSGNFVQQRFTSSDCII